MESDDWQYDDENPVGAVAGDLIEKSGLKGLSVGGAVVSEKHANFIINKNNATSSDIKYLMELAKQYPSRKAAAAEIIRLNGLLNLPKGTEHFLSDIHGVPSTLSAALEKGVTFLDGQGFYTRKDTKVVWTTMGGNAAEIVWPYWWHFIYW